MKGYKIYFIIFCTVLFSGCTKNFTTINTDPTAVAAQEYDPNYLLTSGELGYANISGAQMYDLSCLTQVMASTTNAFNGGDKYDNDIYAVSGGFYSEGYATCAAHLTGAINLANQKDSATYNNVIQMCRILLVLDLQRITDIYGDVPYFQVGKGQQGNFRPPFDAQSAIYPDMLSTLGDAINKLDVNGTPATGDLLYGGNIAQWKKFGYAVMLRVAMRLVKIDPATAQKYAEEAGGKTFTSFSDNAIIPMDGQKDLTTNKSGSLMFNFATYFEQLRWSKTFIDYLKSTNDPRLYYLTEKSDTGFAYNSDPTHAGFKYTTQNPAPAGSVNEVPVGMPNGYLVGSSAGAATYIANEPNYPGTTGTQSNTDLLGNYARPAEVFARKNLPQFMVTYAQTEFLLAEAATRGWNVGGTASGHFANGVEAALNTLQQWNASLAIPPGEISQFVSSFPLDVSSQANSLNQINTQYWVASIYDFAETWSNWRRSGYPVLTPVNYPLNITGSTIPRRLNYPISEQGVNSASYQAAIQKLGGSDLITLRVWWDKQ